MVLDTTVSPQSKKCQIYSKPIIDEFFKWIETSWCTGKSTLVTVAKYTLKRADGLKAFLYDGRIFDKNSSFIDFVARRRWSVHGFWQFFVHFTCTYPGKII